MNEHCSTVDLLMPRPSSCRKFNDDSDSSKSLHRNGCEVEADRCTSTSFTLWPRLQLQQDPQAKTSVF